MTSRINVTMPYLTLRPDDIIAMPANGWLVRFSDSDAPAREVLDGVVLESWDYLRPITIFRSFQFAAETSTHLGVPPDTRYRLVVLASTGRGLHRRVVHDAEFSIPHQPLAVSAELDGKGLCRDLQLTALLSLAAPVADPPSFAPSDPGARIWEHRVTIALEGGRSRLPIEAVSFRQAFAGHGFEHALYHVEVLPYPELDLEEAVLVYLNADYPGFLDAVQQSEAVAESMLWEAVLQRLLRDALLDDTFFAAPSYTEGSLGANVSRWLRQAFPTMSLTEVTQLLKRDSSRFDATIQSWSLATPRLFRREEA